MNIIKSLFPDNGVGTNNEKSRKDWLQNTLSSLPEGWRILDAGAGELANKPLCSHLKYVSQDFCQYEGTGDGAGLQTQTWDTSKIDIVCDITDIPEADGSFDAVLCSEVFEHLPDPVRGLQELIRLVRPGGKLILSAPFCSLTHFAPYHFCSGFNSYFYRHHLEAGGCTIDSIEGNGNYFEFTAQEVNRIRDACAEYAPEAKLSWLQRKLFKFARQIILNVLSNASQKDTGSDKILVYGWQVIATKKELS